MKEVAAALSHRQHDAEESGVVELCLSVMLAVVQVLVRVSHPTMSATDAVTAAPAAMNGAAGMARIVALEAMALLTDFPHSLQPPGGTVVVRLVLVGDLVELPRGASAG
jgi:hypothetical protein